MQWLLYHNKYPDTEEYRAYVIKLAQAFIDRRYVVRITSPLRLFGWLRKKRVNTTFSDDKYLYDFNHVAVSNMHVVVLVQAAENLIAGDRNGFSDPMCRVSLGTRQTAKTRIIFTKTSPVWNEVFTFGVEDLNSQQLIFEVVDYDLGKQADFLGYARLPLREIVQEKMLLASKLAAEQLQRWVAVTSPGASMLRGTKDIRRDEVAASSSNFIEGGHMNDVELLFGDGTQHFSGAMHTLDLGPGPTHSRKNVRGTLRVGAFLRKFNPDEVKVRDEYGDIPSEESEDASSTQKYQLYCQILHARDVQTKGGMTMIGDYVPLLRWQNRVRLKSNGKKKYTNYVKKTTGPLWKEILSIEITRIDGEFAKIKMYQCGQAKTDARCVGELSVPLSLVQIIYPREQPKRSEKGGGSVAEPKTPALSSSTSRRGNVGQQQQQQQQQQKRGNFDASLRSAMDNDDLLSSVRHNDIPSPQWMPLIYSWDDFTSRNGELLLSMWMIPKGGSLFGEVSDVDVYDSILEEEKMEVVPLPLANLCAENIVPVPIALLRKELWSKESVGMKAHYDEKGFKEITVGDWSEKKEEIMVVEGEKVMDDNDEEGSSAGIIREVSFLFPASSMVSANTAYEKQEIRACEDAKGGFVVRSVTQNPEVMYGKSFKTENQFLFQWVGPRATRVKISSQVNFEKRPNGFIAGQIESGVKQGTKESSEKLLDLLMSSAGSKKKRRKKKEKSKWTIAIVVMMVVALVMLVIGYMYLTGFNKHFGGGSIESVDVVHHVVQHGVVTTLQVPKVEEQEDTSQGAIDL